MSWESYDPDFEVESLRDEIRADVQSLLNRHEKEGEKQGRPIFMSTAFCSIKGRTSFSMRSSINSCLFINDLNLFEFKIHSLFFQTVFPRRSAKLGVLFIDRSNCSCALATEVWLKSIAFLIWDYVPSSPRVLYHNKKCGIDSHSVSSALSSICEFLAQNSKMSSGDKSSSA